MPQVIENNDSIEIKKVPIMKLDSNLQSSGIKVDLNWFNRAINQFKKLKGEGYRPTVFIGHNKQGEEKPAAGFINNMEVENGTLYADLVGIDKDQKKLLKQYPHRSCEIIGNRISGLALLGSSEPYFKLPSLQLANNEPKTIINYTIMETKTNEQVKETVQPEVKLEAKAEVKQLVQEPDQKMAQELEAIKLQNLQLVEKAQKMELQIKQENITKQVEKLTLSAANPEGKLLPKNKEKMIKLLMEVAEPEAKKIVEVIESQPSLKYITEEKGTSEEPPKTKADIVKEETKEAERIMKEKGCDFKTAYMEVISKK